MMLGEHRHTLDAKNRTFIPAKLRDALGETVIIARGVDKCLSLYPLDSWQKFQETIESYPPIKARQVKRWIYGLSQDTTIDAQGRIVIPTVLKDYAGLEKNIVSLGVGDHVEIWNEEDYDALLDDMKGEEIAATLMEMGM